MNYKFTGPYWPLRISRITILNKSFVLPCNVNSFLENGNRWQWIYQWILLLLLAQIHKFYKSLARTATDSRRNTRQSTITGKITSPVELTHG